MLRLNGGSVVGSVDVGDKDMADEIPHLDRSEFKGSLRPEAYL